MDAVFWPNFHRAKMCMRLSVVVLGIVCHQVAVAQSALRTLYSADSGLDECSLKTGSNYTGDCHCSALLDIHCTGLDQIPHFVADDDRVFSAVNMADQAITELQRSALGDIAVS